MSATPMQVPLIPFLTLQSLLSSGVPHAWPLEMFCAQVLEIPELSEAPVRVVWCHRHGVHDFILINCDVTTPAHDTVPLWLRIERRPDARGVGVLLNKPKPAMDTVKASTNVETLRGQCEPRDSFLYNHNERPREILKLKNIAEMCRYYTGHSGEYSLLGANCRWVCYVLLECLRESRPCYGGTWLPSGTDRPTADIRAAQLAKSHYLKDKHSACCGRQYLVYPNLGSLAKTTMSWTSIAIANSSQTISNQSPQCTEQDVLYRTPRSLPKSVVPPATFNLTTNSGSDPGTGIGLVTSLRENSPGATASKNSALSNSTPSRPEPGTQNPIDRNATQIPQPLSASNNVANPPQHQHTTTPPAKNVVSQPSGDVSITSHCSGCQCADHAHSQIMSSTPQNGPEPHSSIPDSKAGNALDLSSRVSSMNIGSDMSALRAGYGQSTTDECTSATRGPSSTNAPTIPRCSGCGSQGSISSHPLPPPSISGPAVPGPVRNSFHSVHSMPSERIHPGIHQRAVQYVTSPNPTQCNGEVSMNAQCSSRHAQCLPRADLRNNSSSSPAPRMARIPDGANRFDTHGQHYPQHPCSTSVPSSANGATCCTVHQHRAPSSISGCTSHDHQDMVDARECHHIHNCSPTVVSAPSRPVSRNHPSSYIRAPSHSSQAPPMPTHHAAQGSYQGYIFSSSRNNTGDSQLTSGSYSRGPNSPFPRNSANRSNHQYSQAPHAHPHALPLPIECNANILGDHYRSAPPTGSLYNIPEGPSQVGLSDNWDASSESWVPINEPMDINISAQYGVQPALSNPVQPSPLPNPLAHTNFGYTLTQRPGATFQESYMPNEVPVNLHPWLEQPTRRRWTQEVWASQGLGLPMRTDSPAPIEHNQTEGAYSLAPVSPGVPMPDHHNYTQFWDIGNSVPEPDPSIPLAGGHIA